jgi:hypothetical protein
MMRESLLLMPEKIKAIVRNEAQRTYIFHICDLFANVPEDHTMSDVLLCAAREGNRELCLSAIAHGARDLEGMCERAARGGHRELCELGISLVFAQRAKGLEDDGEYGPCDFGCVRHSAARAGYFDMCGLAKKLGCDDREHEMEGAARGGYYDFCADMYEQGYKPKAYRMMYGAARGNHRDICELVLAKHPTESARSLNESMLTGAIYGRHVALCELAISRGVEDPNHMLRSAVHARNREMCVRAYELGANWFGSILSYCASANSLELCELTMKWYRRSSRAGVDDDHIKEHMSSVARTAACLGNVALCNWAISNGGQQYRKDIFRSVLDGAVEGHNWKFCVFAFQSQTGITINDVLCRVACSGSNRTCACAIKWARLLNARDPVAYPLDMRALAASCMGKTYAIVCICRRVREWCDTGEREVICGEMLACALKYNHTEVADMIRGWMQENQKK